MKSTEKEKRESYIPPKHGEWAREEIRRIATYVLHQRFDAAVEVIRGIQSMGLSHDPDETESLSVHDSVATVFEMRIANTLCKHGLATIGDLIRKTPEELELIPNLGPVALNEIRSVCCKHGEQLKKEVATDRILKIRAAELKAADARHEERLKWNR